ncbi:hypothetical protein RB195_008997 [Necator americanus]|uniref:Uncharacterized protein n=1 Tax=Necator americanus TaxID=51031 RepID=A0ABR1CSI7_NECAM
MELTQQSDVLGKRFCPTEQVSDNCSRLIDLCNQTNPIIASTLRRNQRRHQLTWQKSTPLTPEEQRKCKMSALKFQFDHDLTTNIPLSNIREYRGLLKRRIRFRPPASSPQLGDGLPGLELPGRKSWSSISTKARLERRLDSYLKDGECRKKFSQQVSINIG